MKSDLIYDFTKNSYKFSWAEHVIIIIILQQRTKEGQKKHAYTIK